MKSTKELARQLGLLRRHSSATQQSRDVRKVKKTNQEFAYLIVIDFESTCWKDKRNVGQEIIEFPAVLLNTSTGSIESEFHTYVLPEENTQLSEFCTELTGITQDQVEAGIPLRFCLGRFSRWLKKNEDEKNIVYNCQGDGKKRYTFVTWSDWDLSVCLHYECRRKQLLKPPALNSWIDLRATYKKFYERKPNGLHGALQDVGIEFHGRQHSGLDDARNTASLAWRMMCDGCVMKITRTMPGTQQFKRKPATRSTPTDQQTGQPTTLANRCGEHEDGLLVSHTQGICDETASSDVVCSETFATTSGGFKIWEDRKCSVLNVIKPKTSIASMNGNNFQLNKNGTVLPVQTRLKGQTEDQNQRAESKSCSFKTERAEVKSVSSSFSTNDNVSSHRQYSKAVTNGMCMATSSTKQRDNDILSASVGSRNSSPFTKDSSRRCISTSRVSPKINTLSSSKTPSSMTRISSSSSVFKTPLNTPIQSAKTPTQSSGFKTPYAPVPYRTPGSTTPGTPFQSNTGHTTPSGCKITPPMCGCGRRAKKRAVVSPGPNIGRFFYLCTLGRRSGEVGLLDVTNTKKGCGYFKWESMILASKRPSTTPVTSQNQKILRRQTVETLNKTEFTSPSCTIRTVHAGSTNKRLGITMRGAIRHQNQFYKS